MTKIKNNDFSGQGNTAKVLQPGAHDRPVVNGLGLAGAGLRLELDPPDQRESLQQPGRPDNGQAKPAAPRENGTALLCGESEEQPPQDPQRIPDLRPPEQARQGAVGLQAA